MPARPTLGWLGIGIGFAFVEVAAKTLLQRLGSDETLGRVIGSLESARLAAMALGSIGATVLVELLGVRGALVALGALMPVFVVLCWTRLRAFEVGAPVAEGPYRLLRENSIFAPLPIATLERLSHDLVTGRRSQAGEDVIVQGDRRRPLLPDRGGRGRGVRKRRLPAQRGPGRILRRDRPAARRAPHRHRAHDATRRLLALEREQFLAAVTGHRRSTQLAHTVVDDRWSTDPDRPQVR